MVKLSLKKNAFEIENPEEFIRLANAKADKEDEFYNKLLIPTKHIPLQRVLRVKFQNLFNKVQREIDDQELHELGFYIWVHATEWSWQLKRKAIESLKGNQREDAIMNFIIGTLLVGAGFAFALIFMGGIR